MRFVRPMLALVALTSAMPAAADDGRRHVMTPTQKIDMVRDLPDISAFERDGLYFDLGYIYPIHTMNGASVASADGGGEAGFVLYHDDRFVKADSSVMADLQFVLGEDPTQGYTPPVAASSARSSAADSWDTNGSTDAAKGEPIKSPPARTSGAGRGGGFTIGTLFLLFLALFVRVRAFRDLVIGGVLAAIAGVARRKVDSDFVSGPTVPDEMLASQAAAQRARLEALSTGPASSLSSASGGFGRKGV